MTGDIFQLPPRELHKIGEAMMMQNKTYPVQPVKLPESEWIHVKIKSSVPMKEIWRSNEFMIQIYQEHPEIERMSVNRTRIDYRRRRWLDGISWDNLQYLKHLVGRGEMDAVEIYPRDSDIVDVSNMRHLWVFNKSLLPFAWRNKR